jgi:DNA-binding response OmpR family regulator
VHELLVPCADSLSIDPAGRAMSYRSARVDLSPTEARLLARLLVSRGSVVHRQDLWAAGWSQHKPISDNLIDQCISRLRHKLRAVDAPQRICAVRGIGHQLMG